MDHASFLSLFETSTGVPDALLERYNLSGPRYTSYPTAPVWAEDFAESDYRHALYHQSPTHQQGQVLPLSLYMHLPFCEERCLFCSCNVIITKQKHHANAYLDYLVKEIDLYASQVDTTRPVVQLHWGGGTPTYMSPDQLARLFDHIQRRFMLASDAEIALEVDPRVTTPEHITRLRQLGFNRVSMGVQDFAQPVQESIRRLQSFDQTRALVELSREQGFDSVNTDLIYGLPYQTLASFEETVDQLIALSPDRVALYNFAHVPWISPHQKYLPNEAMPHGKEKYRIFRMAIRRLLEAGYLYIGMDHFAKPGDELAVALDDGTLHRNFMGYTTRAGQAEMLGMGVSAISSLVGHYAQNVKKLTQYYAALDAGRFPLHRGYALTADDALRRFVIQGLMCQTHLSISEVEQRFAVEFASYFKSELAQLLPLANDGLVVLSPQAIALTPLGRIFARNVAMVFDAHLAARKAAAAASSSSSESQVTPLFSKTL